MTNGKKFATPYDLDGRIPLRQAIPLGLQHVLAMFVGNLSPLLIIMATCKLTDGNGFGDLRIALIQNAMIIAGLITFLQLYPIGPVGARLPIVMGTSSGFIGVNNAIAGSMMAGIAAGTITSDANAGIFAYGAIMGACIVGGVFEMGLGFLIRPLRKFFPAVVTGTVVIAIGLSLIPVRNQRSGFRQPVEPAARPDYPGGHPVLQTRVQGVSLHCLGAAGDCRGLSRVPCDGMDPAQYL